MFWPADSMTFQFDRTAKISHSFDIRNMPHVGSIICFIIIYFTLSYVDYVFLAFIILTPHYSVVSKIIHVLLYHLMATSLSWFHFKCITTETGVNIFDIEEGNGNYAGVENEVTTCGLCHKRHLDYNDSSNRQSRRKIRYCRTCKKCIAGYDHHCIWIANCVAAKNLDFFKAFLLSLLIISIYVVILVLYNWNFNGGVDENVRLHSVLLILQSTLYGLFVLCVLLDVMSK